MKFQFGFWRKRKKEEVCATAIVPGELLSCFTASRPPPSSVMHARTASNCLPAELMQLLASSLAPLPRPLNQHLCPTHPSLLFAAVVEPLIASAIHHHSSPQSSNCPHSKLRHHLALRLSTLAVPSSARVAHATVSCHDSFAMPPRSPHRGQLTLVSFSFNHLWF